MSDNELKLIEIAKEIIKLNVENIEMALTGSLMLSLRGINKRRESNDIDIICKFICEKPPGKPNMPKGYVFDCMSGEKSAVNVMRFVSADGVKVDLLTSDEKTEEIQGIYCGQVEKLLDAKYSFSQNDIGKESKEKHELDLEYILANNSIDWKPKELIIPIIYL